MEKHLYYYPNHTAFLAITSNPNLHNVIYCNNEIHVHYDYYDYNKDYLTFVAKENGTFTFIPQNSNVISYSTDDGETWIEGNTVSVNNGDKVLWKGTMTPSSSGIGKFGSTANFDIQGNVMSLLFEDNYKGQLDLIGKTYAFRELFKGNTKVINARNLSLPATTLANYCYASMFYGCTSLTTTPELPATTLANQCYQNMFQGCTSLTTTPELPATTLALCCYLSMFQSCTSLTVAPELPVTTLADGCYQWMFYHCTSLTVAPELPATTLANGCYLGMFQRCTSLTEAPELPATILTTNCYQLMFSECTSLTTAPVLPATTLTSYCYNSMFQGCTSLTVAPELPATTLANSCYQSMFRDCTSMTTAPELPATTLASYCYNSMFYGCTSLNYIKCLATNISAEDCTYNWVNGVSNSGSFITSPNMDNWILGVNGIPNGWIINGVLPPTALMRIWIDDFPSDIDYDGGSVQEGMEAEISDLGGKGANPYLYYGETIDYNGNTYYLWKAELGYAAYNENSKYFVTTTVDFNTLYSQSLEEDLTNHFTAAIGIFNDSKGLYRAQNINPDGDDDHYLIKVEDLS